MKKRIHTFMVKLTLAKYEQLETEAVMKQYLRQTIDTQFHGGMKISFPKERSK